MNCNDIREEDCQMANHKVAVNLRNLSKCYHIYDKPRDRLLQMLFGKKRKYYREFWALKDVSFELKRGETLGIVGRNGAGKSTLLQLLCGTLNPTGGKVTVNGRVAALLELGAGFNPEFTGRENVYLNAAVLGLSREEIDTRYDAIVAFSGIGEFINQPVKTYSSGMYVRLAFSVATSVEPDILIIDEALSVGDGEFARKSFDRIMELKEAGTILLFCSHSMFHIEALCNQVIWLDCGNVMMIGGSESVVSAYNASLAASKETLPPQHQGAGDATSAAVVVAGQAHIDRIEASADGITAKCLKIRSCESDLSIQVSFSSDPKLPAPTIAFGLETKAGISVSSAGSLYDGVLLQRSPDGSGMAELLLPKIPLMRGSYRLSVYLACERMIHVYDHATYCIELEVYHPSIEQGVVFLPHQWYSGDQREEQSAGLKQSANA